jgi:hypothetical protein
VLPLVLVMALALIQVGVLIKDQIIVEEAARAGAREAAVTVDDGEVRQAVEASSVSLDADELVVTVDREGGAGSPVTVIVVYHSSLGVPLVSWLFPSTVDVTGAATMRQEIG